MMRAALYARVSSAIQRDRHTIESQLRVLPEFAIARGWTVVGTYVDDGRTAKAGHLAKRAGVAELLEDATARRFDVVVVIDLDRFTRSEDLIERAHILGTLQRAKVLIANAATGAVHDVNTDEGDLQIALGGYFAAAWARKHRTRVVEGKLTAIAKGKKPAGPTPFGYRYDRVNGVWSIDELEAAIVREVFTRALAGETADTIAADLSVRGIPRPTAHSKARRDPVLWERSSVYRMLNQTAYRGEWTADKARKLTIDVPAIVEPALWYAVHDRMQVRGKRGLRRTKHVYLCEGLAVCDLCGGRIGIASASTSSRRVPVAARYICENRRKSPRDRQGRELCGARYWPCAEVDDRVWTAIAKLLITPGRLERVVRKHLDKTAADTEVWRADLEDAEKRMARLARSEAGVLERYHRGMISDDALDAFLASTKRDRAMAQHQLDAARRAQAAADRSRTRATELESLVAELRELAAKPSPEKRHELVARVLPQGAIRLSIATVTLQVALEARATQSVALVSSTGYQSEHESNLKIRVVA